MFNLFKFFTRIRSAIHLRERTTNIGRRFGAAPAYYPAYVIAHDGKKHRALFTDKQIEIAIERAAINPEEWQ